VPKLIKFGGDLTKFLQKQVGKFFWPKLYLQHVSKTKPLLFFEQVCKTLADFNNFWHATLRTNVT